MSAASLGLHLCSNRPAADARRRFQDTGLMPESSLAFTTVQNPGGPRQIVARCIDCGETVGTGAFLPSGELPILPPPNERLIGEAVPHTPLRTRSFYTALIVTLTGILGALGAQAGDWKFVAAVLVLFATWALVLAIDALDRRPS